jgi:flagellar basal body rod protein FlgF
VNKEVLSSATRTLDLTIAYDGYVPVGYKYQIRNGKLTIKDARVSSGEPAVIKLTKRK